MERVRVGSTMGMLAAAAAAMSLWAGPMVQSSPQPIAVKRRRPSTALREPSGQSFRSLRRAFNAGWKPPVPDEKALMRHAWYRKELYWAALRERLGQA